MIQGSFFPYGTEPLHIIKENMDGVMYPDKLEKNLNLLAKDPGRRWMFLIYSPNNLGLFSNVTVLALPIQSFDLSSIKNV